MKNCIAKNIVSAFASMIVALSVLGLAACGNQSQHSHQGESHSHEQGDHQHEGENSTSSSRSGSDLTEEESNLAAATDGAKAYPLDVCIVSDEKLGSMGEPESIVWQGQTVKFCCSDCIKEFKAKPEEHLAKLAK